MVRFKKSVLLEKLHHKMIPAIEKAEQIYYDAGQDLWITSMNDSHKVGLHPKGRAMDTRTRFFTLQEKHIVYTKIKAVLGREFDVVLEDDHIHIEYDPK